ncbi:28153_t:CDS:2 [Dentiscutata erythropus]|uniref:28153_t:CDS:1 n=1 Tax=Dentiscutata erythropus TaxID=1348616 RepID=A0A9N9N6N4_9GLOM|nr:28153_t:CDS:2 [Dentiscutata erythropus]
MNINESFFRKRCFHGKWKLSTPIEINNNALDGSTSSNELQSIQHLSSCSPKSLNHLFTPKDTSNNLLNQIRDLNYAPCRQGMEWIDGRPTIKHNYVKK